MNHTVGYKNGQQMYDRYELSNSTIPSGVKKYYATTYPNQSNYRVWSEDSNGITRYFTVHKRNRLYFDNSGGYQNMEPIESGDPMYDY